MGFAAIAVIMIGTVAVARWRSDSANRDTSKVVTISGSAPIGGFELHRREHRSRALFSTLPSTVSADDRCRAEETFGTLTLTFDNGSSIHYAVCPAMPKALADVWQQGNTIAANTGPQCAEIFRGDTAAQYEMPVYLSGCYNDATLDKDTGITCTDGRLLVAHDTPHAWAFVDSYVHLTSTPATDDPGYKSALETCNASR